MDILDILAARGVVDPNEVPVIEHELDTSKLSLEEALAKRGISPADILAARGEYYNMPIRDIEGAKIPLKNS